MKIVLNKEKNFKIITKYLNILYIEDEKNIRDNITKTLKLFTSNVYSVENTVDALTILDENRIDLIISDINLPGKNGIDFIKELRAKKFKNPVIFISAYTNKEFLLEAAKLKLVDYLVKPIDFNMLKSALINASEELIDSGSFIVEFNNDISYNVLQKKLLNDNLEPIDLTAKEILLLDYLIENHQRVVLHNEIKECISEDDFEATDSALKNILTKLRKKIGKESIENISGVGFRIKHK